MSDRISPRSPLARLVLVIIGIAIAGTCTLFIVIPKEAPPLPPANDYILPEQAGLRSPEYDFIIHFFPDALPTRPPKNSVILPEQAASLPPEYTVIFSEEVSSLPWVMTGSIRGKTPSASPGRIIREPV